MKTETICDKEGKHTYLLDGENKFYVGSVKDE